MASSYATPGELNSSGHLRLQGVDLVDLAQEHGTPLFVFDEERIRSNYRRFSKALSEPFGNVIVYYSIKTNNLPAICRILAEEGADAEIASGLDMHASELAGFQLEKAAFDGLYKNEQDLRLALHKGIGLINIESFDELRLIDKLAASVGKKQEIGLRLNPGSGKRGFLQEFLDPEWVLGYPTSRFGFSLEDALTVCKEIKNFKNLRLTSIMTHPYYSDIKAIIAFAARVWKEYAVRFEKFNLGGGFTVGTPQDVPIRRLFSQGVRERLGLASSGNSHETPRIETIASALHRRVREYMKDFGVEFSTFCFEPGRYLLADAGLLLLRIVLKKKTEHGSWVIADGGTNLLFGGFQERRRIVLANRKTQEHSQKTNIAGPLLYRSDIVTLRQDLPPLEVGDLIAVFDAGAYNLSRSSQFMFPRPPVLLIHAGGRKELIRAKESYAEVLGAQG